MIDNVQSSYGTLPLKNISEVSRAWRERSKRHIFRNFHPHPFQDARFKTPVIAKTEEEFTTVFSYVQDQLLLERTIKCA